MKNITRPNCALDKRVILCLFFPGFLKQVYKHVKILLEQSKKLDEQNKNKEEDLCCEYRSQFAKCTALLRNEIPQMFV